MRLTIPKLRLPSLTNTRWCWQKILSAKKKQKKAVKLHLSAQSRILPPLPLIVTITRVGPRKLDDDNLQSACKYIRDQIAAAVGVDDGSDQYTWRYEQRIGKYCVEVEITPR